MFSIYAVEDGTIYYEREVNDPESCHLEVVSYQIASGQKKVVSTDAAMAPINLNSKYIERYKNEDGSATVQIEEAEKHSIKSLRVDATFSDYCYTYVLDDVLYMINLDMDAWQSTIYKIDAENGSILKKNVIDGFISSSVFYHGLLCFYSSKEDKDESVTNEKISVYNFSSDQVSLLTNIVVAGWDHLRGAQIEAGCGYLWVYCRYGGDGFYADYIDRIKIPPKWYQ